MSTTVDTSHVGYTRCGMARGLLFCVVFPVFLCVVGLSSYLTGKVWLCCSILQAEADAMPVDPRRNKGSRPAKTYEKTAGERETIQIGRPKRYDVNVLPSCVSK